MTTSNSPAQKSVATDLVITRVFDAPRELVWKAWTDPEHLMRWWGPEHFTSPVCKVDFRVGGKYLFAMRSPEGQDFWSTGTYKEIVPLERIVYTDSFSDADGNLISPETYGFEAGYPIAPDVTLTFEDQGGKTRLTIATTRPVGEMGEMAELGFNQSLDKLAASLR